MLKLNVQEFAALTDRLRDIEAKIAKKALRTAARKGMTIVRDEVKANAPEDTSTDADNIKTKTHIALQTSFRRGVLAVRVGVRGGAKKNPDTPYYWRMVEFGTQHIAAKPFMQPALENNAEAVIDRIAEELRRELDKA
jgi:HK97 gp10 family phage protein